MSSKGDILRRVKDALGVEVAGPQIPRAYRAVGAHARSDLASLFVERVQEYGTDVVRTSDTNVATTAARALGKASRVVVPPALDRSWLPPEHDIVVDHGMDAQHLDAIDAVVTACSVAIAETGTIVLDGSADQGRRAITLIPDLHVCIVRTDQIVDDVPAALGRLDPTRPQTWISGPSATSDIELKRVEGVHGPRTLVVVLVDTPAGVRSTSGVSRSSEDSSEPPKWWRSTKGPFGDAFFFVRKSLETRRYITWSTTGGSTPCM